MSRLTVVRPPSEEEGGRMSAVLRHALAKHPHKIVAHINDFSPMAGDRILFAIALDKTGLNLEAMQLLRRIRQNPNFLQGTTGGILIDGKTELDTKSTARDFVFSANQSGCTFPGRSLVEGTGSLYNFQKQAKQLGSDLQGAYADAARRLVERILVFQQTPKVHPKLLVLHASSYETSNTLTLWHMVREHLSACQITELSLRNGSVYDCAGCPYTMCMHFSRESSCYFGGVMVEEVYPAIQECDALLLLCPNYNDALSANLSACINRLTALFRQNGFYEKNLFGIVVSGYSGGDIVAKQLIGALHMNKSFILPPRFALLKTANDPGSIQSIPQIKDHARLFAQQMLSALQQGGNA